MNDKELAKLTQARRASTEKELTEKARKYILQKAGLDENGKEKDVLPEEGK